MQVLFLLQTSNVQDCRVFLVENNFPVSVEPARQSQMLQFIQSIIHNNFSEYDFSDFDSANSQWRGKYIRGNKSCLIYVNLYRDLCDSSSSAHSFVIEAVKAKGDGKPFLDFYRQFKELMILSDYAKDAKISEPVCEDFVAANINPSLISTSVNSENVLKTLEPIVTMEECPFYETKLEASRMLYDLSKLDQGLINIPDCVILVESILTKLVEQNDFFEVSEQAIITFASFCENPVYQRQFIHSDALGKISSYVCNSPETKNSYEMAQLRRECARILSLLAQFDASGLIYKLGRDNSSMKKWLLSLDHIVDERMKVHTDKLKKLLSKASVSSKVSK